MTTLRPITRVRSDLNSILKEMDHFFEPFVTAQHPEISEHVNGWFPAVDILEGDKNISIKASIPGYTAEDIDIEIEKNIITLSGCRQNEALHENERYLHQEMITGRFSRKLTLPFDVVADEAKADFSNGVLHITLPKAVQAKKIKIEVT